MQAILVFFWQMCLLRDGPEKIPPSTSLAYTFAIIYLVIESISLLISRSDLSLFVILGIGVVGLLFEVGILFGLLSLKQVAYRFRSTLIAVFGCNALILLLLVPFNLLLKTLSKGLLFDLVNTISLICLFWWITVVGFILHRSANISIFQGVALAFVIELLVALLIRSVFPQLS